ncbi:MAG: hypothetical protein CMJ95_08210 [Planctomycetes bacterium]|nr:hypothetical protein [Planctomycetota bacterium]|tara:strand:- start:126 stop:614 length:489 start_codon:yes stop_codon:yes gene_type:complete
MSDLSTDSPPIMELPEVVARIPLLEQIGNDLIKVMERKEQIVAQCKKPGRGRDKENPSPVAALKQELRGLANRLTELREEVQNLGGTIAQTSSATLEFLGEVDGCIAWFSWQPGEESIHAWRPVDGEPGERFPLPGVSLTVQGPSELAADQSVENNEEDTVE